MLLGGLLLMIIAVCRRHRFAIPRSMPMTTFLVGSSVAVYQSCYFSGISRVGVAMGSIVTVATVPVVTGVVAYLLRGDTPTSRWYSATALTVLGGIGAGGVIGKGSANLPGLGLCVTAGSSVAVYTVLSRRLLDGGAPVVEVTTIAVALSGFLLLPVILASGTGWLGTVPGVAMAVYLGVITSALGFWLNARGLARTAPTTVATLNLAEPLTATVLAFAVLGERLDAAQTGGAAAMFLGLVLLVPEKEKTDPAAPPRGTGPDPASPGSSDQTEHGQNSPESPTQPSAQEKYHLGASGTLRISSEERRKSHS